MNNRPFLNFGHGQYIRNPIGVKQFSQLKLRDRENSFYFLHISPFSPVDGAEFRGVPLPISEKSNIGAMISPFPRSCFVAHFFSLSILSPAILFFVWGAFILLSSLLVHQATFPEVCCISAFETCEFPSGCPTRPPLFVTPR